MLVPAEQGGHTVRRCLHILARGSTACFAPFLFGGL
jgi:hypothetical protein